MGSWIIKLLFLDQIFIHQDFIQVWTSDQGFNQGIIESDTLKVSNKDDWVIHKGHFWYLPNIGIFCRSHLTFMWRMKESIGHNIVAN